MAGEDKDDDQYRSALLPCTSEQDCYLRYSTELFQIMAQNLRVTDEVTLRLKPDYPCLLEYGRAGVDVDYIIAPRIESD